MLLLKEDYITFSGVAKSWENISLARSTKIQFLFTVLSKDLSRVCMLSQPPFSVHMKSMRFVY